MSENESMRNVSMEVAIILWVRACLSIVGSVGRHDGRLHMYLWVSHTSSIMKSWGKASSIGINGDLWCCW